MDRMKHMVTQTWDSPFTEAYFTPQSIAVSTESPNVYYTAGSNFSPHPHPTHPTYLKLHQGEYKRVYRLPYPKDGSVTREHVLRHLPQLNVSGKITRNGPSDRPIASGGFADVHKSTINGQSVAIKVMRTSLEEEKLTKVERMSLRELFTWSQLTHENILELLGYTFDYYPPCISFVSSWQENGNATSYLRGKGVDVVRQVLAGAARGLKYLHGKQIVHGDFRGNNILISQKGEALVADFGFAKILELAGLSSRSPPGGNVRWMAPELLVPEGSGECTHTKKSDMWSLGMTILELCSSEVPYCDSLREVHVLLRVVRGEFPEKHDRVPELLWNICTEFLWCIDPVRRLTVDETITILTFEAFLDSSPPKELIKDLTDDLILQVASIVVRSGTFVTTSVHYWRSLVQRALKSSCHDSGHGGESGCDHTPLHHLAMAAAEPKHSGSSDTMTDAIFLFAHPGIKINTPTREGQTALHYCVLYQHNALLDDLLARPGIDVNVKDLDGKTPLCYAIEQHYPDEVAWRLLRHPKIDVNATDLTAKTLLHRVIFENKIDIVKVLLKHDGINVNAKDGTGRTPLSHSVCPNRGYIFAELLSHPLVDINSSDMIGRTPLHYAAIEGVGNYDRVCALLQRTEIDVNITDWDGRTALSYATEYGFYGDAVVRRFLCHPAINIGVNTVDSKGRTALHYAVMRGNDAVVLQLLSSPTLDLCIRDYQDRIPLSYATENSSAFLDLRARTLPLDPLLATEVERVWNGVPRLLVGEYKLSKSV